MGKQLMVKALTQLVKLGFYWAQPAGEAAWVLGAWLGGSPGAVKGARL